MKDFKNQLNMAESRLYAKIKSEPVAMEVVPELVESFRTGE